MKTEAKAFHTVPHRCSPTISDHSIHQARIISGNSKPFQTILYSMLHDMKCSDRLAGRILFPQFIEGKKKGRLYDKCVENPVNSHEISFHMIPNRSVPFHTAPYIRYDDNASQVAFLPFFYSRTEERQLFYYFLLRFRTIPIPYDSIPLIKWLYLVTQDCRTV